jgi:hypothetical protein
MTPDGRMFYFTSFRSTSKGDKGMKLIKERKKGGKG